MIDSLSFIWTLKVRMTVATRESVMNMINHYQDMTIEW